MVFSNDLSGWLVFWLIFLCLTEKPSSYKFCGQLLLLQLLGSEVKEVTWWIRLTGHPESVTSLVNFPAQCSQRLHLPRILALPMLLLVQQNHFCDHHIHLSNDHYDVFGIGWWAFCGFVCRNILKSSMTLFAYVVFLLMKTHLESWK